MKKLFFLLIWTIFKIPIYSETYISGLIDTVQNWTPKSSPYIIDEIVMIDKKGFVTIYPGTEVKFKKGAKLMVYGALHVKGNESNPVRFISADGESFYEGIVFYQANKSIIEFSVIMRGSVTIEATKVDLSNNYILNSTAVILKNFADVLIKDNYFYNNTYGIYIEGHNIKLNLIENTFINNRYGIYIMKCFGKEITIKRNNFIDNKNNIISFSTQDIDCRHNYWGTVDEKKIARTIIDRKINPKVGEIIFKPYSKERLNLFQPPAVYISLVKAYLNKKKKEEDIYRLSFGGGILGFFPLTPETIARENNFGLGYFATFTFNPFGPIVLGVESNFFMMENKDKSLYGYNLKLSEILFNVYGYFSDKANIVFVPYARFGNGICIINESYHSKDAIFEGKNTLINNDICYSLAGGAGLEWFLSRFFSLKLECLYHYIFNSKGNISFPDIKVSCNIYFNTPFIMNR